MRKTTLVSGAFYWVSRSLGVACPQEGIFGSLLFCFSHPSHHSIETRLADDQVGSLGKLKQLPTSRSTRSLPFRKNLLSGNREKSSLLPLHTLSERLRRRFDCVRTTVSPTLFFPLKGEGHPTAAGRVRRLCSPRRTPGCFDRMRWQRLILLCRQQIRGDYQTGYIYPEGWSEPGRTKRWTGKECKVRTIFTPCKPWGPK